MRSAGTASPRSAGRQHPTSTPAHRQGMVDLSRNECPLAPSPRVQRVLMEGISRINCYPEMHTESLKEAIAQRYKLDVSQISVGNGSTDLLRTIAARFAAQGGGIIYSQYSFFGYPFICKLVGAEPVAVPMLNWRHHLDAIKHAVDRKTKLIFIDNPNNPTGTFVNYKLLSSLLDSIPSRVIVVIDEAYAEYNSLSDDDQTADLVNRYPNVIVTRTFSKAYGLAGLRVGYALASSDTTAEIAQFILPYNVNALAVAAAKLALEDQQHLRATIALNEKSRTRYYLSLERRGLSYLPSRTNFVTFEVGPREGAIHEHFHSHGITIRSLAMYGLNGYCSVTTGTLEHTQLFERALQALD